MDLPLNTSCGNNMKKIDDILFIVQARLNSQRAPYKMLRPFKGTNLYEICLDKIKQTIIPVTNFYASIYEPELIEVTTKKGLQYYHRSIESANNDNSLELIYEWHNKFPQYKYCVLINACNLFLKPETIDKFIDAYCNSEHDGMFAVMPKKQYYWNKEGELITPWPDSCNIMNTKEVEVTLEAAHVLYAGRLDLISQGYWMGKPPYTKNNPALFEIDEFECLDIDHEWQFDLYTNYWKMND